MNHELKKALEVVRAKRGMEPLAVHLADKATSHREATRVTKPRSQKKRKYNARHRAKSAEWLAKKKAEGTEAYPLEQPQRAKKIGFSADFLAKHGIAGPGVDSRSNSSPAAAKSIPTAHPEPIAPQEPKHFGMPVALTAMQAAQRGFNIIRNRNTGEHFYRERPNGELS